MISRFEYNIQTGNRKEVMQRLYTDEGGEVIALDVGVIPPIGYVEFTGDLPIAEPEEKK